MSQSFGPANHMRAHMLLLCCCWVASQRRHVLVARRFLTNERTMPSTTQKGCGDTTEDFEIQGSDSDIQRSSLSFSPRPIAMASIHIRCSVAQGCIVGVVAMKARTAELYKLPGGSEEALSTLES